jgi:hypothetical protein
MLWCTLHFSQVILCFRCSVWWFLPGKSVCCCGLRNLGLWVIESFPHRGHEKALAPFPTLPHNPSSYSLTFTSLKCWHMMWFSYQQHLFNRTSYPYWYEMTCIPPFSTFDSDFKFSILLHIQVPTPRYLKLPCTFLGILLTQDCSFFS